jgi:hypothetical protein
MNGKPVTAILAAILPLVLLVMATQTKGEPFRLIWSEEATIADIHAALKSKEQSKPLQYQPDRLLKLSRQDP